MPIRYLESIADVRSVCLTQTEVAAYLNGKLEQLIIPVVNKLGTVTQKPFTCTTIILGKEAWLADALGFHSYWADYMPRPGYRIPNARILIREAVAKGIYTRKSANHMERKYSRISLAVMSIVNHIRDDGTCEWHVDVTPGGVVEMENNREAHE